MQRLLTGQARLPGYGGDWVEKTISMMGYTYSGITGKCKDDFGRGDAQYITFLNVLNNPVIDTSIFERVDIQPSEKQNATRKGDLFFNTSSETPEEVGICSVLNEDVSNLYLNSFCFGYRLTDENVSGHYLAYFWRSKQGRDIMSVLAQGATRYNLSKEYFNKTAIKLPATIAEQRAIVEVLADMDAYISLVDSKLSKKKLVKEGTMQRLLTGKTRLPGYSGDWIEKTIGKMGSTYSGITGKCKDDFGRGDAQYITFLNVLNNPVIDTSIFERVDIQPTERQNAARKGDLFFNTSSETPEEVGICSVLNEDVSNLYLNSFCFGYRLTDENVLGHYLAYFWRCKQGRDIMSVLAQGATRYNLSKEHFNKTVIKLPATIAEQRAIVEVLTDMDEEIKALEVARDKYILIKQGMMQKLLTGQIRLV